MAAVRFASFAAVIAGLGLAITPATTAEDQTGQSTEEEQSLTWSVQPADEDGGDGRPHWEFELEPGQTVEDVAQVNNFSSEELTFRVYSHDAVNTADGGFTLQPADAEPVGVGAWVGLDEEVTIEAGESAAVPFSLTVPADATPGDHAGGLVASLTSETTDAQGQRVRVDNRVGSRIYLRVAGAVQPTVEVTDLAVSYERSWIPFSTGSATITYEVHNAGNIRLGAEQAIDGHGVFGLGEHAAAPEPLDEILPGGSVAITEHVGGIPPLFRLTEEVVVTPVVPQTSADVLPVVQAAQSAQAWAIPWVELVILAALLFLLFWSWRRRRRAKAENARQIDEAVARAREEVRKELQGEKTTAAAGGSDGTTQGERRP
ncbi:MAG TPA: DUF916 domain-containing protein [Beutenbergiaceae bacterium]|nr:DUF916 domain-containing protein [Beutenbergiaceae bacterium]